MKKKFVVLLLAGGILSSQLYFSSDAITRVYASEQQVVLTITGQPQNQSVAENSTAVFKVTASGNGLKYQWQWSKSTTGGWTDTTLTGCKTSTLSVPAESFRNGMYYRCVVSDATGKQVVTNAAQLKLAAELNITGQPQNQSVAENSTAVFKVAASGDGLKYQWQWSKSTTGGWTDTTLTGCKTSTLSVPAESFRNGMYYRCVVTDQNGKLLISNVAKLTILKTDEWELPIM